MASTTKCLGSRLVCLALVCLVVKGCGSNAGDAGDDGGQAAARQATKQKQEEKSAPAGDRIAQILRDAEAAMNDRDWPLARQTIEKGLVKARQGGYEFETSRARLLLLLGDLERDSGTEVEARRHYADAMAIYRVQKDSVGRFTVHLSHGDLEAGRGDYAAAAREYSSAEALLGEVEDQLLKGDFLIRTGRLASRQMRREDAVQALTDAAKIFDIARAQESRAEALLLLAGEEDALGHERQCRSALDKALRIFREIGNKDGEVRALHKAASLAERNKQYKKARSLLKQVRELYLALDRQSDATKVLQHLNALPE